MKDLKEAKTRWYPCASVIRSALPAQRPNYFILMHRSLAATVAA